MTAIQQGLPHRTEALSLLNEAYDAWGTHEYFRWKYDLYPDYRPEEHTFHIRVDGELAAFRRVFCKEVVDTDRTNSIFVLGDTAVGPAYRGQGLYSKLHANTVAFSEQQGTHRVSTFNRKTNVTYEANRNRGWRYRELPLKLRVLSPDVVLRQYSDFVLTASPVIETVADQIGERVHIGTSNGTVSLRDCLGSEPRTEPLSRSIGPSVSDRTLAQLIDLVCSDDSIASLQTLVDEWVNPQNGSTTSGERSGQPAEDTYQVHRKQSVSMAEFETIVGFYDQQAPSFRRTSADIRHLLRYPDCDILLVTLDQECVGYAVVGPRSRGDVLEGRVLELRVEHDEACAILFDEIEQLSVDRGYDIILVFADRPLGDLWASVNQQVIMWQDLDQSSAPLVDACAISLYDVV